MADKLDKTYRPDQAEGAHYKRWEEGGYFKCGQRPDADPFTIVIPPPNVTGSLHMGHALNNTIQDVMIRYRRMAGRDTLWQPGMDHAGIATQMVVERKLAQEGNLSRRDMGRDAFIEKVWEWKGESGGAISNQLRRLGASCDWSRERFTMDEGLSKAVLKVFVDLYRDGLIYKDKRLVNWDPALETAISDLEVQQVETKGKMWFFRYPVEGEDGVFLTVGTTRPETMLGDTGVCVHPDDERYKHLVGKNVILPLVGRAIPIVADSYADPETGTGAVKMTPAHDFNDFEVGKRHKLRVINIFDEQAAIALKGNADFAEGLDPGVVHAIVTELEGKDRFEARKRVVEVLEQQGFVEKIEDNVHMVPFGDRSGVPIEPFLTDQWYVNAKRLAGPAMEAVHEGKTQFVPANWSKTYFEWMENIQPWCVSRQLWWGHQIPAWYGPDGKIFVERSEADVARMAQIHYGGDVTFATRAEAMAAWEDPETTGTVLYRDEDVLDTWFSSALWPFSTLGWPERTPELRKYYPTSVLSTGFDIIFFWVARMMMMQLAVVGQKPFDTVYVHALVRDEKGKKMSKSLGNVLDPLELIDEYGADAVRFTLTAMAAMGRDLKLSTQRIAGYRNFGTKLWNAARFAEMNGVYAGGAPSAAMPAATATVNRWILGETARVREEVDAALAAYRFDDAANALYRFVWGKVCDWYVEFAKPLLQDDAPDKAETQAVMGWVIDQCLILLHPMMPFITEELWGSMGDRPKMLIHTDWPAYSAEMADPEADREMTWVIALIEDIRSARAQMHVPAGLQIPLVVTGMTDSARAAWDRNEALIKRLARIDSLSAVDSFPKGCITVPAEGATFGLPLADVIDVAEEKARLEKSLQKLGKEIGGLSGRLKNPKFIESAPEEVVEETRENLAARQDEEAKLKAALERMAELG